MVITSDILKENFFLWAWVDGHKFQQNIFGSMQWNTGYFHLLLFMSIDMVITFHNFSREFSYSVSQLFILPFNSSELKRRTRDVRS
jgi:hypothetical protein